jgi:ribonuclease E
VRDALEADRARIQIGRISRFGLLEMSRQRLRPSLEETTGLVCPRCNGTGVIRDVRSLALSIMRVIEEEVLKERTAQINAQVPISVATFLLNEKRAALATIESRSNVRIVILPNEHLETPHYEVTRLRDDQIEEGQEDQPTYKMVERIQPPANEDVLKSVDPEPRRQEAAVKMIQPQTQAPAPIQKTAEPQPATAAVPPSPPGFFAWLSNLFGVAEKAPEPVVEEAPKKPEGNRRRSERDRRDGNRQGGRNRNNEGNRETRESREPRQEREPREPKEAREPRENNRGEGRGQGNENRRTTIEGRRVEIEGRPEGEVRQPREPREPRADRGPRPEREPRQRREEAAAPVVSAEQVTTAETEAPAEAGERRPRRGRHPSNRRQRPPRERDQQVLVEEGLLTPEGTPVVATAAIATAETAVSGDVAAADATPVASSGSDTVTATEMPVATLTAETTAAPVATVSLAPSTPDELQGGVIPGGLPTPEPHVPRAPGRAANDPRERRRREQASQRTAEAPAPAVAAIAEPVAIAAVSSEPTPADPTPEGAPVSPDTATDAGSSTDNTSDNTAG